MKLYEYLLTQKKEEICECARIMKLTGISKLNKKDLAKKIADTMIEREYLKNYLSGFTENVYNLLCEISNGKVKITKENYIICNVLTDYFLSYVDNGYLYIFDEVNNTLRDLIDNDYYSEYKKVHWLIECMSFADDFYGIYTVDDVITLAKLNEDIVYNEFEMVDLIVKYNQSSTCMNEYISNKAFDYGVSELRKTQEGKDLFIPTCEQISFYYDEGYLLNEQYNLLKETLIEITNKSISVRRLFPVIFQNILYCNIHVSIIIEFMMGLFEPDNEIVTNAITPVIIEVYNNTNMISHRGNTPIDIRKKSL